MRTMTFARTWHLAQMAARALCEVGDSWQSGVTGAAVLVTTDDHLGFVAGFFGSLIAGAHPVPVPDPLHGHDRHRERVLSIADSSRAVVVLAPQRRVTELRKLFAAEGRRIHVLSLPEDAAPQAAPLPLPGTGSYWQYSSGTGGRPARVVLDDTTALAHLEQAAIVYDENPSCVSVNWVPLHHDMGLVTSVLRPLWSGYDSVMIPAGDFVRQPETWLAGMTRFGATHTSAPDFGYALAARKVRNAGSHDLSQLRVARVAGELVRQSTLRDFANVFSPSGFRPEAFAPSYGMAEATLTVTTCAVADKPRVLWVDRTALAADRVVPVAAGATSAYPVVSCGRPLPDTFVTIVAATDEDGTASVPAPATTIGEVHIAGPQVAPGPGTTAVGGRVGRLTGDFGFVVDDELYLLGRSRERFQVNGENHYLPEIEEIVATADDGIRPGRVLVVPSTWMARRGRGVVVVAELTGDASRVTADLATTGRRLIGAVARHAGLTVDAVRLVPKGTLPLTSSGKLRRHGFEHLVTMPGSWSFDREEEAPA